MTELLDGKAAIVTGAASGIAAATVRIFVEEGARVLVVDLRDQCAGGKPANTSCRSAYA